MDCSDENIIALILQPGAKAEMQAVKCLKKCEAPANGVLLKMSLREEEERRSVFYLAVAEFIIKVRQGKFALTGAAKICTFVIEIAARTWKAMSLRNKDEQPEVPPSGPGENKEFIEKNAAYFDEEAQNEHLQEALRQLSASDRNILVAFYFYEQSLEDYAKQNKMSHDAAKKRISRARERLKNLIKPAKK